MGLSPHFLFYCIVNDFLQKRSIHDPRRNSYNRGLNGSIITSNDDLTKYLMEMLKLAKKQPSILFSQEGADLLFSSLLEDGLLPEGYGENQSVFWFLNGQNILHTGSDPGTTCEIIFDNQGQAGYFILTNMDASTEAHTNAYFDFSKNASLAITRFLSAN